MMKIRMFFMVLVTLIVLAVLLGGTLSPAPARGSASAASGEVELVGQIGGSIRTVAVQGAYAYIGVGPRLVVLNISNPAHPTVAGQTAALEGLVQEVVVLGNYAYVVTDWAGLYIINIATPAAPVQVGFAGVVGEVTGVAVRDNYAYVVGPYSGLRIFNITHPAAPIETGFNESVGGYPHVEVAGDYLYVAAYDHGLQIVNISNPAAPTEAGSYQPSKWWARDIKVRGDYAYVAASNGLRIIRITNPADPTEVGSYEMAADNIAIAGNLAYLTGRDGENYGLRIVDITNPNAPQAVGFYPIPGWTGDDMITVDIAAADNYTYLVQKPAWNPANDQYLSGGLNIVNTATPAAPTPAGFYATTGEFSKVTVACGYAYAVKRSLSGDQGQFVGGLNIFDVTHPATTREVGVYYPPREAVEGVDMVGNYAYIGTGRGNDNFLGGRLRILNISNPAAPFLVGSHSTPGVANDVAVVGNYAYIAETPGVGASAGGVMRIVGGGLRIFDIANPAAPIQTGYYAIPDGAIALAVAGNYAYLAAEDRGLWIINITNPAAPTQAGVYTEQYVQDVAMAGSYAYVGTTWFGLRIIDITHPATPTEVGAYESRIVREVAVAGDYAYISVPLLEGDRNAGQGGLGIINITNPTAPTEAGFYDTPGFASDVMVVNNYIYVADGEGGLLIFRFTTEPEAATNPLYLPVIWKN